MRKTVLLVASMALAVLLACGVALAAAGDLDPTFSGDGRVTTSVTKDAEGKDVVALPGGKLAVAGHTYITDDPSSSIDFALASYNPDGSLNRTFSGNGRVVTRLSPKQDAADALIRQPDGKLVAAGYAEANGTNVVALVRYNPDGSLDQSFGEGGKVLTDLGDRVPVREIKALIRQPDGKLVAGGSTYDGHGNNLFTLVRYNPDGSIDESFGEGGKVLTRMRSGSDQEVNLIEDLLLQPNGKIVASGSSRIFTALDEREDFALARYNPDGSLDRTFGGDGKVLTSVGDRTEAYERATGIVIQSNGKLVAAGYVGNNVTIHSGISRFALVRYNPDGSVDRRFGEGGEVTTSLGGSHYAEATDVVLQPDGRLVAGGWAFVRSPYEVGFALARYNPDGSLNKSFGTDGKVITTGFDGSGDGFADALALRGDGKVVAVGSARNEGPSSGKGVSYSFAVARYLP